MRWADAAGTILADQSFLPKPTDEDRAFVTEWARRRVSRLVATRVFPADRDDPYDAANEAARDVTSRLSAEVRRVHDAYLTIRKRVRANKGHLTLTMQKVAGIDRGRQVRTPTPAAGGSPLLFRTGLVRSAVYEATAEDMAWVDDDPVALARLQKLTDRIVRTVERMVHQIGDVPEYLRSGTVTATSWPDGYRRMFDYPPFSSDSPTPNPAAAKCWRQNPADHDELDFTPGTPAEGGPHMVSDAIDRLFTPSDDYFKRNLFFCDHTIMALHLEALDFADHALDAELEQIPPPLRERWIRIKTNIASGVFVGGAQESAAGGSLHFLHTRTRTANLRVGDHVLFWNHPVYPYVLPGGAWGLENALVVQTVPEILLQGHGTAPLTPDGMKARVVSALNSRVIDIRANLRNMLVLNEEARARGEPEPYPPEQYLGQYSAYHYTTYQTRQVRLVRRGAPPGYTGRGTIGTWWVAWECDPEEASIASDQSLDGQERREYIQNRQSVWHPDAVPTRTTRYRGRLVPAGGVSARRQRGRRMASVPQSRRRARSTGTSHTARSLTMSRPDSVQQLATELATAMLPLEVILQHDDVLRRFLRNQLGYAIPDTVTTIGVDPATVQAVIDAFAGLGEALAEDAPDDTRALAAWTAIVVAVTAAARDIFAGPNALTGQVDAAFLAASRVIETLPRRLLDWLILERLEASAPALHSLLVVLGIAETTPIAADASTYTTAHQRRILHYERVGRVLSDPVGLFGEVYGWGAPDARLDELLLRLSGLGTTLGVLTRFGSPSTDLQARLYEPAGPEATPEDAPLPQLRLPLVGDGNAGAGLSLVVVPRITAEGTPGIALMPFAGGGSTTNIALDDRRRWFLSIKGSFDATAGIAVVVRPGRPLRGIVDPGGTGTTASGHVTFELRRRDPTGDPFSIARFGETTRLSATELILGAGVVVGAADDELFLEIGVHGGELQLALTDADSFVREILPDGIRARLDLTLGFSSRRGAYFQGGAGLELTQPLHASVGPVSLDSITIALAPGDETLELSLGVTAALRLGPVTATIGRVGTAIRAAAPDGGGNLGPLDLVIRVKPPDGVGLSIEAGPVTGGGFLSYDAEQQQYAGAVRLEVERLTLGAIGLLTTRLPGGADGYSLVLLVTSSGFAPVPLGYGFTLTGVGGLFGVNRTVAVEALRAGLRDHTLDAVLVSQTDPVPRAAQIVGTLRRVFPPAVGRYLFGPMAIIEWGTPTVLTLDLAVLLELPAPLRLVVG